MKMKIVVNLFYWQKLALCCSFFFLGIYLFVSADSYSEEQRQPNILLLAIETLRADHVHCYGYKRQTTPNIDKLARDGIIFSRPVSTSCWTMPSHMSMLTSLYPSVHKTTDYQKKLDEKIITLAEVLKENGYTTAGFVSNPTLEAKYGFGQGFDHYDDFTVTLDWRLNLFNLDENIDRQSCHLALTSPVMNNIIFSWLEKNHRKRFFIFAHYFDPHYDYVPPSPYDTMFDPDYGGIFDGRIVGSSRVKPGMDEKDLNHIIALYDGEIRFTDEYLGELFKKLDELELIDNTLIILVGDHGDEFFEHGQTKHGNTLYEEVIYVPLIIRHPFLGKGKVFPDLVSDVDIMPTILDFLNIKTDLRMQGESLLPLVKGEVKNLQRQGVYSEVSIRPSPHQPLTSLRAGEYKFIYNSSTRAKEMYNLKNDPQEKKNLISEKPEYAKALEAQLLAWLKENEKLAKFLCSGSENKVTLDEETKEKLRSLGYLQ